MRELNAQEVSMVSGGYYDGAGIPSLLGNMVAWAAGTAVNVGNTLTLNLFKPVIEEAYKVGETLTTLAVNFANGLAGGKQYAFPGKS
ncbi:hypothetical protein [Burkholderia ubonensis]|uniref:hypothetical protein n=1 Tax=Burkholderia ubonensis TaxID=101571 RepID=UPI0009B325FE|nr:hypothetical protein [Burkholderia ubonensis]